MTQAVIDYLADRRQKWLDKQITPQMDEAEQLALNIEANSKFSLAVWLPDAAKRAGQLSMVSHPGKFTHPSAKTSSFVAEAKAAADGYVRSGNVNYPLDVFGNAAAMDVYKFLALQLEDGQTVLQHLEQQTLSAASLFSSVNQEHREEIRMQFLGIKSNDGKARTDYLIKQVYFPVAADYHLLSILTPSGMLTELKQRIDALRFSDEAKAAREARRNQTDHATGFNDLLDLTVTAYGGSKPQNISVLNNQNNGRAYLLASTPPELAERKTRLPSKDFFGQTLRKRDFEPSLKALYRLLALDINNKPIRDGIKNCVQHIVDEVVYRAHCVRAQAGGWSAGSFYAELPKAQKMWLDATLESERLGQSEWQDNIADGLKKWLAGLVESQQEIKLGDAEYQYLQAAIIEVLQQDKRYF